MICQRCRTHLLLRLPLHQQAVRSSTPSICSPLTRNPSRFYSDISATPPPPTPRQPGGSSVTVPSPEEPAPAGTPNESVKPDAAAQPAQPSNPAAAPRIVSSCPVGTKLEGLNYFKNKPDLFAKEDHEYPDWLWTLLDDPKKKTTDTGGVDMSKLNKKQRKRLEKKLAAQAQKEPPKVPLHQQATDITPASYNRSGEEAADALQETAHSIEERTQITKSAREARRKGIRESNFLRGM
ncbi:hypothetical protein VTN49DRAFT_6013 [Thermomyces lanuginosus]|uniref:mitochondrial 54S ribosomal protein mL54 n=1 Tax=Thermomyces lanuginosus TaxID=5541 RepID=UPI0037449C1C